MKKKYKLSVLALISISLLGVGVSGCSNNSEVAQYGNNKKITQQDFYNELKQNPASKTVLANMLIYDALKEAYGNKVNQAEINKTYDAYKNQYGVQFNAFLENNNYTRKSFKQLIEINYLSKAALKAQMKPTQAQLKAEWKNYQPKITVQHILTTKAETANEVVSKLDAGASFDSLANEYSVDNTTSTKGGKLAPFNMTDKKYDTAFKKAAYKLKEGEYTSQPVPVTNGYEIIKMIKHPAKGSFSANKKALTQELYDKWANNSTIMQNVISQVLKDQKVEIKDQDLKSALDQYKGKTNSANKITK
ncbi:peptidylprolyl isomerase [Lactobacillus hominis]|uniref:peptidylprolyl isomerase n=1 Tax=Lactobacillus hominis TaxID=1203033 RepID=UPI0023F1D8A2|nr:peptidylprolyl isomerase [Lactobacillus hominis]